MSVEYGTRCPAGHWLVALSKRAADRRQREAKEKARKAEREKKLPKTIKSIRNRNVLPDPENEWPASTQYLRYKYPAARGCGRRAAFICCGSSCRDALLGSGEAEVIRQPPACPCPSPRQPPPAFCFLAIFLCFFKPGCFWAFFWF